MSEEKNMTEAQERQEAYSAAVEAVKEEEEIREEVFGKPLLIQFGETFLDSKVEVAGVPLKCTGVEVSVRGSEYSKASIEVAGKRFLRNVTVEGFLLNHQQHHEYEMSRRKKRVTFDPVFMDTLDELLDRYASEVADNRSARTREERDRLLQRIRTARNRVAFALAPESGDQT